MSDNSVLRFFGGLLIAAGLLIASLSGLCSLGLLAVSMDSSSGDDAAANLIAGLKAAATFGGVPFLLGVALIVGGRAMMKPSTEQRRAPPPTVQDPEDAPPRNDL